MRYFISNSGTLTDISKKLNRYKTDIATIDLNAGTDYLYIGADAPFNHLYFKMASVVNANNSKIKIELWDNNEWLEVVETIDETEGFSKSGFIEFVPDRDEQWQAESTNDDGQQVEGLSSIVVYDLWWMRISVDISVTSGIELQWSGHLFSIDDDLYAEYPVFNSNDLKNCFESGKSDWEEQHVKAAEIIIKDLKKREVIDFEMEILDKSIYELASVAQVARIIYGALGDDYRDDAALAKNDYQGRIDLRKHKIDKNKNAILDKQEKKANQGFMSR